MKIYENVKTVINDFEKNNYCNECAKFEKAVKEYNELVRAGYTKPRGNTLAPIEKKHNQYVNYL